MLKAIIFDVDGVLVDSMRFHADAWVEAFREAGLSIKREDIYEIEGGNNRGIVRSIFEKAGKNPETEDFESISRKKREILDLSLLKPFDGMVDCLKELKQSFHLALVSGSSRMVVGTVIENFFSDIFEVIVTGSDVENGKPSPEPYLKGVEKLSLPGDECLVVENAPMGIEAAKAAGLYCVAVASTLGPERLQHADLVFENHAALFEYLKNLVPD
ncbi:Beta-phosphoglucomutase [Methanosarcina lacustris Z-7289]|uniref:Beta-phosphoglucomutase n=1 Tax=Methanosarcina lacustris Z-7289 TaxID=1434111 RepID=A0A0E3S341_9EURY|nr:HAD family phosphatase [Methanosarcina lacustris]AKB73502.1 Beta-phosphoglucomutase [Methanosarcina lacustris Z-7289]